MKRPRLIGRAACLGVLLPVLLLASAPTSAQATISGGCSATAVATRSGSIDLTNADVWHVHHNDLVTGEGKSPTAQTFAQVQVVTFGIATSLLDRKGNKQTGSAGPFKVSDYDRYIRVLLVTGKSDSCDGSILVVVDDVSPQATLAGLLGLIIGVLGLLGLVASLYLPRTLSSRLVGTVLGLLAGLGWGEFLRQAEFIDPRTVAVIVLPAIGVVIGVLVPGSLHRGSATRV